MVLNSAGFKRSIQNVQSQANVASNKMAASFRKIGTTIVAAFSVKMITAFGKSCIDLGSDLAEVQNVVDVTFTSMSNSVNEWAKNAASSYGLSETMAKKYVGTFGSMAEAFGFTEKQSYDMATALAGLTGDVASFYNLTQDEAYTKLKSVFSGETESLKDLGVVMTQSALDSYALSNGFGKTTSQMTEAEKVTLRYNFVLNQLKNASGDFARTQNSWANQTRILQLRFDSLKATLGQGLINVFTPVIKVANSLIERLTTVSEKFKALTEQVFGNAGGSAESAAGSIANAADSVNSLTDVADSSSSALDNIADSAEKAKKSVAGFDKLNVLSQPDKTKTNSTTPTNTNQTNLSAGGLAAVVSKSFDKLNSKSQKVIDSIKKSFGSVKGVINSIGDSWSRVWKNGSGEKLLNKIKDLLKHCFDNVGYIADAFKKAWDKAGLGDGVIQSIIDRANSLIGLIDTIAEDFGKVWSNGVGERIWGNILNTITNCNEAAKTLRDKIKEAWDKNDTGKKIWGTILGIVEDITGFMEDMSEIRLEWLENLDLSPIATSVEKLAGAFRELLKACGDKLKTVYKNILLPLAKWTIEKGVPKLVEMLAEALNAISKAVKSLKVGTLNAMAGAISAIGTALITFKAGSVIAGGINKIKTALKLLMTTLAAHPVAATVTGIAAAITGLVTAIKLSNQQRWKDLGFEDVSNDMQNALDKINACKDNINEMCEEIDTSLSETSTEMGVIDDYKARLDELLSKTNLTPEEQAELVTIGDYFSQKYPDFEKAWNDYIKVDDNGKVTLKSNVDEIEKSLDSLIEKYKSLAANQALSDLAQENQTSFIKSQEEVTNAAIAYKKAEKDLADFKKEWDLTDDHLKSLKNSKSFYTWQNKDSSKNSTAGDLLKEYNNLTNELDKAKDSYDSVCESTAQFKVNGNDIARMQAVVNGNYNDASAVLMAYNEGLITSVDVEKSKWKSLDNLKSKAEETAKETGSNIIFGMSNGIDTYKKEVSDRGKETAKLYLSTFNYKMGIHSPSREMYKRGIYTVEGLANGIKDAGSILVNPLNIIVGKIRNMWDRIKGIFTDDNGFVNIKNAIWNVFKTAINALISGINSLIRKPIDMLNGAFDNVRNFEFFGQKVFDWLPKIEAPQIPKLAKGGIIKAPTLAVVGDNAGASTGNPEVVAPLNKLRGMIDNSGNGYDTKILVSILDYLKRIYEMFVLFRNNGGNEYEFVATVNGSTLFKEFVKEVNLYKRRHNGALPF